MEPLRCLEAHLTLLRYFVNDTGHIRKIEYPDEDFQFWTSTCDRYNDLQREAMHSVFSAITQARSRLLRTTLRDARLLTLHT